MALGGSFGPTGGRHSGSGAWCVWDPALFRGPRASATAQAPETMESAYAAGLPAVATLGLTRATWMSLSTEGAHADTSARRSVLLEDIPGFSSSCRLYPILSLPFLCRQRVYLPRHSQGQQRLCLGHPGWEWRMWGAPGANNPSPRPPKPKSTFSPSGVLGISYPAPSSSVPIVPMEGDGGADLCAKRKVTSTLLEGLEGGIREEICPAALFARPTLPEALRMCEPCHRCGGFTPGLARLISPWNVNADGRSTG